MAAVVFPTAAQMAAVDLNLTEDSVGKLTNEQLQQVYVTFVASAGAAFNTPELQRRAWAKFLISLAHAGFSRLYDPGTLILRTEHVANQAAVRTNGNTIESIINAIQAAVPTYTHTRLSRTIPDMVSSLLNRSGRLTNWGVQNGMPNTKEFIPYAFPMAMFCSPPPPTNVLAQLRITATNALNKERTDAIGTGVMESMAKLKSAEVPKTSLVLGGAITL